MTPLFILAWIVSGLIGSVLLRFDWWYDIDRKYHSRGFFCISPFHYILYVLASSAGFILFTVGLTIYLLSDNHSFKDCWFFRPICDKKKDYS